MLDRPHVLPQSLVHDICCSACGGGIWFVFAFLILFSHLLVDHKISAMPSNRSPPSFSRPSVVTMSLSLEKPISMNPKAAVACKNCRNARKRCERSSGPACKRCDLKQLPCIFEAVQTALTSSNTSHPAMNTQSSPSTYHPLGCIPTVGPSENNSRQPGLAFYNVDVIQSNRSDSDNQETVDSPAAFHSSYTSRVCYAPSRYQEPHGRLDNQTTVYHQGGRQDVLNPSGSDNRGGNGHSFADIPSSSHDIGHRGYESHRPYHHPSNMRRDHFSGPYQREVSLQGSGHHRQFDGNLALEGAQFHANHMDSTLTLPLNTQLGGGPGVNPTSRRCVCQARFRGQSCLCSAETSDVRAGWEMAP